MNPEENAWEEMRRLAGNRLPKDFAARVLSAARQERRRMRRENRIVLAVALACLLSVNLVHWFSTVRTHRSNLRQWQELIQQTEILETTL